jgi:hypothetical protein
MREIPEAKNQALEQRGVFEFLFGELFRSGWSNACGPAELERPVAVFR